MYRAVDRVALTWILFVLFGSSLIVNAALVQPVTNSEIIRVILTTPATFGLMGLALGATPLWRWFWLRIPRLNEWVFPDLNGRWRTEIRSNFATRVEHHSEIMGIEQQEIERITRGEFNIVQNWFRIHIRFASDDRYSTSDTIVVEAQKNQESGRFSLICVYKNKTPLPGPQDEQFHFGAAHVEINAGFRSMTGVYWTNRNASRGLNSAGTIHAEHVPDL